MSISGAKLEEAFEGMVGAWRGMGDGEGSDRSGWVDVRILESFGTKYLRITRRLSSRPLHERSPAILPQDDFEEDDDEALHMQRFEDTTVLYDIVHTPSYQVPALHITLFGLNWKSQQPPAKVFELLVPIPYKDQVRYVGVMGALSMTEHPITGLPAYFVHPCKTQDALAALGDDHKSWSAPVYLMRWIGLIGSSVGLSIPVALVEALTRMDATGMHGKLERS